MLWAGSWRVCILLSGHIHVHRSVRARTGQQTDLRTICPTATSDGHRGVLRRSERPCTHTHTYRWIVVRGHAWGVSWFYALNSQLIYCVGLVGTLCLYACVWATLLTHYSTQQYSVGLEQFIDLFEMNNLRFYALKMYIVLCINCANTHSWKCRKEKRARAKRSSRNS